MVLKISTTENVDMLAGFESKAEKIIETVLTVEGLNFPCEISLLLCDNDFIKDLNARYRQKDSATDVLSFPQFDSREEIMAENEELLLGDIIISMERAREQAEEFGHSIERECFYLLVHGLLHLLGYNHKSSEEEREMRFKEEAILRGQGFERK